MKLLFNLTRLTTAVLATAFLIVSCQKEQSENNNLTPQEEAQASLYSTEADAEADVVFNDVFDNVMGVNDEVGMAGVGVHARANTTGGNGDVARTDSTRCFTVTILRSNTGTNTSPFPITVILDFGNGCVGRDGHLRSGKIITTYTNRLVVPGAKATTRFENFYFDSIHVEGVHEISNVSSQDQMAFKIVVEGAKLTKPNGNYSQWNSRKTITRIEGNGTPFWPLDDVFKVEGLANGKVKRGDIIVAWNSEITEPLIKKFTCPWIIKGIIRVARLNLSTNSPWVATLNYGNGLCDNKAILTVNGVSYEITLP